MTDLELIAAFCTHISAVEDGWRTHAGSGTIPPNVQGILDLYKTVAARFDQLAHYPAHAPITPARRCVPDRWPHAPEDF